LRSHLIKYEFMEDYRCCNKNGEEGHNETEMRDSYLEREVPHLVFNPKPNAHSMCAQESSLHTYRTEN
jgi:hypothetical protein